MKNIIKSSVISALLALSAQASAQSVTFNLDYLANNGGATSSSALPKGNFAQYGALSIGTISFTDLADLGVGNGVRTTISLNSNLNQFSVGGSGAGSIFVASFMTNFFGTSALSEAAGVNWNQVNVVNGGGVQVNSVEMRENGTVTSSGAGNNWGNNPVSDPAFEQEINFSAGSLIAGATASIDWLNAAGYNGFSVAQMLANPVDSQNSNLPNVYAYIRVRSTGGAILNGDAGQWWGTPSTNANGGRLDVLAVTAVTAVPEAETYAMMMAGLALIGTIVRRRKSA